MQKSFDVFSPLHVLYNHRFIYGLYVQMNPSEVYLYDANTENVTL